MEASAAHPVFTSCSPVQHRLRSSGAHMPFVSATIVPLESNTRWGRSREPTATVLLIASSSALVYAHGASVQLPEASGPPRAYHHSVPSAEKACGPAG